MRDWRRFRRYARKRARYHYALPDKSRWQRRVLWAVVGAGVAYVIGELLWRL